MVAMTDARLGLVRDKATPLPGRAIAAILSSGMASEPERRLHGRPQHRVAPLKIEHLLEIVYLLGGSIRDTRDRALLLTRHGYASSDEPPDSKTYLRSSRNSETGVTPVTRR